MSYYSLSYAIQTTVDVISGSTNPIDYSWPLNNSPLDEYDKSKNRRIEVILIPKLDELFEIISNE